MPICIEHVVIGFGIRWFHERRMAFVSPVVAIQFFHRCVIWFDTSPRALVFP